MSDYPTQRIKSNPIKFIIRVFLGEHTKTKIYRGVKTKLDRTIYDGYKLDQLEIGARLKTREDVDNLIDFLTIHKYGLPF